MKNIIVASSNPVKLQAALAGFKRMFPDDEFTVKSLSAPSGVSDQPRSDAETRRGALNRARAAQKRVPTADFWVGIEGGIEDSGDAMWAFAWIIVLSSSAEGSSRTGIFQLPSPVIEWVRQGKELGDADDIVFGRSNSKQQDGAVGILTGGALDRAGYYEQAVLLALIPLKNGRLYAR